jgi:hypothetical protein
MMGELTPSAAPGAGDALAKVVLVPVEVFGASEEDCPSCPATIQFGYGLMDAVSAWSDCNRAIGHIYRVEDLPGRDSEGAPQCITVYVPQSEVAKFAVRHGEGGDRCPACKVPYGELPDGHRLNRPTCSGAPIAAAVTNAGSRWP